MPIISSELKLYKSQTVGDLGSNGGKMSINQILSNVREALFPDVTEAERLAGITRYRKAFLKVADSENLTLYNPKLFLPHHTPADDYCWFTQGTQGNTQADLTGSEQKYGAAPLKADVLTGATTFSVTLENITLNIFDFVSPQKIWIGSYSAGTGEFHSDVTAVLNGPDVDFTLDTGDQINADYAIANEAVVASVLEPGDVETSFDNWVETTSAGTFDESGSPLVLDNIATIEETWTLTMTNSTTFTVSGASIGSVGGGNIATNFEPVNSDFGLPYFSLPFAGWGGVWATGESIVWQTHPAALPLWFGQTVPAGSSTYSDNAWPLRVTGQSS